MIIRTATAGGKYASKMCKQLFGVFIQWFPSVITPKYAANATDSDSTLVI